VLLYFLNVFKKYFSYINVNNIFEKQFKAIIRKDTINMKFLLILASVLLYVALSSAQSCPGRPCKLIFKNIKKCSLLTLKTLFSNSPSELLTREGRRS